MSKNRPSQDANALLTKSSSRKFAPVLAVLYVAALVSAAIWLYFNTDRWDQFVETGEDSIWIAESASRVGLAMARNAVLFLLLGFFCGAACASFSQRVSIIRLFARVICGLIVSVPIALMAASLMQGPPAEMPTILSLLVLCFACFWGCWLGATWMNRASFVGWAFRQMILTVAVLIGGMGTMIWLAVAAEPLDIAMEPVGTEDRRRLVEMFQSKDPRKLEDDETAELEITEKDLNQLASWGLSLVPGEHRARVELTDQQVSMQATSRLPVINRYLNLTSAGSLRARDGEFVFTPNRLQIGNLSIPKALFQISGPIVLDEEWQHGQAEPFFRSLESIEVGDQYARVAFSKLEVEQGMFRDTLVNIGLLEDLEESCNEQVRQLVAMAEQKPMMDFSDCLESAMATAQARSQDGDALRENRAAIMTLAFLLGHPKVRAFAGDIDEPPAEIRKRFMQITLRDRRDWTQHFLISAALQVIGNRSASMDVGILKEELDADGGSGFSFGDLLADRSGTRFAAELTGSESRALAMQSRIIAGVHEDEFIPAGADLPEGLPDAEFQSQFGGVGGPEYNRVLNEIDRRIAELPGYSATQATNGSNDESMRLDAITRQ